MQCPKCFAEMETISTDNEGAIRIARCGECHGLYFDQLTKADLSLIENNTELDTGDAEVGAEYNDTVYVECPKCDRIMDQLKIEEPVWIRFELCRSCHSTFLDAGEFKQYLDDEHRTEFEALLPD